MTATATQNSAPIIKRSYIEEKALTLLGAGVSPEQTANTLGVTPSAISQLLSREDFAIEVTQLRYEALSRHNSRDAKYDELEDKLLAKMEDLLPLMMRPREVMSALRDVNAAKRRGQSAPEQIHNQQTVVSITIPVQIVNRFVSNQHNQVVQAGDQELLTIQSGSLLKQFKGDSNVTSELKRIGSSQGNRESISGEVTTCEQQGASGLTITPDALAALG
jgi:hypothetical protein